MPKFDSEYVYYLQERIRQLEQKMFESGTKNPFRPDLDRKRGGKRSRKLSGWQKFVKANSNKKKFKYASGKLNLKKMGVAYRNTAVYKRNKKK